MLIKLSWKFSRSSISIARLAQVSQVCFFFIKNRPNAQHKYLGTDYSLPELKAHISFSNFFVRRQAVRLSVCKLPAWLTSSPEPLIQY